MAFHTTHRKGHESKLLVVHSKSGRCNFWGLLHYDDRRSPWWASRVGPQHDHGRSDTVMIGMNLNSYATLAIFFHHFCFAFEHETTWTTRVLAVFDFYYRTQACNLSECENHENLNCPFRFPFEDFVSAYVIITSITAPGMSANLCLVVLLLFVDSEIHFQLRKKTREKSRKRADMVQFGRWRGSLS